MVRKIGNFIRQLRGVRKKYGFRQALRFLYVLASAKIVTPVDEKYDRKICGCSLVKFEENPKKEQGYTGSQSTRYWILDRICRDETFDANDRLIDVGCGKGRVLAYFLLRDFPGKLAGVEMNEPVAEYCRAWASAYPDRVSVICGDAFDLDYNDYTVLFMCRPLLPDLFHSFIGKLETELTHPIRLFYWVDQQSGDFLNDRPGWRMHRREKVFRIRGLAVTASPQRYSVWTYTPPEQAE